MNGELQLAIETRIMTGTTFQGVPTLKQPMDAWVYQEIIWELEPEVIVEIGNRFGGSLLYLAAVSPWRDPTVIGVDIDHDQVAGAVRDDPRVTLVEGDAADPATFACVDALVAGRSCLVIEDSAHTYENTLAVLRTYGALVHPGGYMICEDGVMEEVAEALTQFSLEQTDFVADPGREWPVTWNPGGYLRRVTEVGSGQ